MTIWGIFALLALANATHIGHKCGDHDCMDIARWRCFWPGQTRLKCEPHRDGWARVADTMGFELRSEPCDVRVFYADDSAERFAAMELD